MPSRAMKIKALIILDVRPLKGRTKEKYLTGNMLMTAGLRRFCLEW